MDNDLGMVPLSLSLGVSQDGSTGRRQSRPCTRTLHLASPARTHVGCAHDSTIKRGNTRAGVSWPAPCSTLAADHPAFSTLRNDVGSIPRVSANRHVWRLSDRLPEVAWVNSCR